ncbi:UNVERIFIED_CONTAM: hypothetical protein Scaly_2345300 [Sesamum calycinum]|uniref:Uncharacterized protein n=1 Tax=Sesamum calycinum TaxID=2727403 RepID=A0AAW2LYB2_9LAMI
MFKLTLKSGGIFQILTWRPLIRPTFLCLRTLNFMRDKHIGLKLKSVDDMGANAWHTCHTSFGMLLSKMHQNSGDKTLENEACLSTVPIHVVTDASQLPAEFLQPSCERQLVIGFDCEGVDLCRDGSLCIMQLAFPDAIYLVDAIEGGETLVKACKPALESSYITKVIHDCKRDSEALYFQFGIKLHNVVDTRPPSSRGRIGFGEKWCAIGLVVFSLCLQELIAYSLIKEQEGHKRVPDDYISFVGLLADPRFGGISYVEKEEVRLLLRQDPNFWTYRPLSELMVRAAADDVRFLLFIYHKMVEKLNERSLWYLAVRGALYCRCFCIDDSNFADWPPLPPIPVDLVLQIKNWSLDHAILHDVYPREEILSVLDVPRGKMGCVIGKRGANILSIKQSCSAEIFFGGDKGPPDKVFIIGPVKQVRKAEAMLRGRMLQMY